MGARLPLPGDLIKSNGSGPAWEVVRSYPHEGFVSFECKLPGRSERGYFNYYEIANGRIRSAWPCSPGTTGYSMNFGGVDGGYDWLEIVLPVAQGSLF